MPSFVESGQVSESFAFSAPSARVVIGAALALAACAGAAWEVRALDRTETVATLEAPTAAQWSPQGDGQRALTVASSQAVPAGGAVRLRACAWVAPPELWMEVRSPEAPLAAPRARVRLTGDRTTSPRCVEARWDAPAPARATVTLVTRSVAPGLRSVTARTGGVIRGLDLLPLLLLALGVGAMVLAPRRPDDEAFAPTLPWPTRGVEGIVLMVVAFLGVHAAAQLPVAVWGFRGTTMLASVLAQQAALALASAGLLGAFTAARPRTALELTGPAPGWLPRALAAAAALVGFAMVTALALKDAGDAPIARAVDAMPTRYVIAFGAICAPLPEELFFRGLLGRMAEARLGTRSPFVPVVLPALFFAAMHAMQLQGAWLGLVPIAAVGLVNGWLRWTTRGLVVPWAVHTLYNGALALAALT